MPGGKKGAAKNWVIAISRAALVCAGARGAGWRSNPADAQHYLRDHEQ
jgi:hypothetical protein